MPLPKPSLVVFNVLDLRCPSRRLVLVSGERGSLREPFHFCDANIEAGEGSAGLEDVLSAGVGERAKTAGGEEERRMTPPGADILRLGILNRGIHLSEAYSSLMSTLPYIAVE